LERHDHADAAFATRSREAELAVPRDWLRIQARALALTLGGVAARPPAPALRCFFLHFVYDDQRARFRLLLERLVEIGRFVDGSELLDVIAGRTPVDAPCFHLSFDDAFDNNHRNAFPVLDELGIRATFFVPSAMVGAPDQVLRDEWWAGGVTRIPTRTMDWAAVRELADAGHEIGSHTRRHKRLSEISTDPDQLRDEVLGSKKEIEDALGKPCRFFSWPYGTHADIDAPSRAVVEEAGYEACFSAVRGVIAPGETSAMDIPRHHMEGGWPWLHVRYFALGRGDG
jgi:peptidoglycan/xylan/chitin deacetylase (PgdA/CDA1 family)